MVREAVNIPAHGFYPCRKTWLEILGKAPLVIFYCGSSNGRGPRVAGWFQDTLDEAGQKDSEAIVLAGGIKRWAEVQNDLISPVLSFPAT
jgi:arsenical-resistance protein 2